MIGHPFFIWGDSAVVLALDAAAVRTYPLAPVTDRVDVQKRGRITAEIVNDMHRGWISLVGEFTATPAGTSTTVTDRRCHGGSVIFLMPASVDALSGYDPATTYIITLADGSFTVAHPSAGAAARFRYLILG